MRHLGELRGVGRLLVGREDRGEVSYEINVFEVRYTRDGQGQIWGDAVTPDLVNATGIELRLEGEQTVSLGLRAIDPVGRSAQIQTSGPLPGF